MFFSISKNKVFHYIFFSIISLYVFLNGGNSNITIQLNFLIVSIFFFICTINKNYKSHLNFFLIKNKLSILFFFTFLLFVIFQTLPIPIDYLKYFSKEKYFLLNDLLDYDKNSSLSLSPSNTFFQFLNFLTIFLIILIVKMIFYKTKHIYRFYFFISFLGAICSFIGVFLFLNDNNFNSVNFDNSAVFIINKSVFSLFLIFCLIGSLEILKYKKKLSKDFNENFFLRVYIRLFILLITVGIITTFSRLGNFLFVCTIFFYFVDEILLKQKKDKSFLYILLLIIFFDILILGYYFGADKLIQRFYFLQDQINNSYNLKYNITRINLMNFSYDQIKNYFFFGYGGGSFERLFQIKYSNLSNEFADHAHSDFLEFFGEYGIFGFSLFLLSILTFLKNKKNYSFLNLIMFIFLVVVLIFDFFLHIPIIQVLFSVFLILNKKKLFRSI